MLDSVPSVPTRQPSVNSRERSFWASSGFGRTALALCCGVGSWLQSGGSGDLAGGLDRRLQVGQRQPGRDPHRHAGGADRERAVGHPGEHARAPHRVLDEVMGGDRRDRRGGDRGEPRGDRERPPDRGGEDQERPVPHVPGVGDAADVARRAGPERRRRRPPGLGVDRGAGEDQGGGADGRQHRRDARERGGGAVGEAGVDDRREAGPPDRRGERARDPHRPQQRQRGAEAELPGATEGVEVGGGRLGVGELDAEQEGTDQDQAERDPRAPGAPTDRGGASRT